MNIFAEAARLQQENKAFAFAQIVESRGSTPRHQAQMLILAEGQVIGTIGGGMVERMVIEEALQAIKEGKPRLFRGRMTRSGPDAVGSDCGGVLAVHIAVHGLRSRLILLGAGHVNRAVAQAAHILGFDIHVADTYPASLAEHHFPPGCRLLLAKSFTDAIEQLAIEPEHFVLIATNSQDMESLEILIERPLNYIGLLCSRRKLQNFTQQLQQRGITESQLQKLFAPVGFNIGAETPEELAISIMAEILTVKNRTTGGLMKDDVRLKRDKLVVIRGAGDIATGVALRLYHSGFQVVMLDLAQPTVIRRTVAFAQGMFAGECTVEGVTARKVNSAKEALALLAEGTIPLLVDEEGSIIQALRPRFVVDAILAKQNLGTTKKMAPITIALGPGFNAGEECDAVIETNRGHYLGRVIYQGHTQSNTGIPGVIAGYSSRRLLRAPCDGVLQCLVQIGDIVQEGDLLGTIASTEVIAPLSGMVRGLLTDGLSVSKGCKIGDIDPRGIEADYLTVSDKARAIGGAVLEAMLSLQRQQGLI